MNVRFYNCRLMKSAPQGVLEDGELWVQGYRIAFSGTKQEAALRQPISFERELDCQGNLLLPGFKDAHTHSGMTFLRSHADDLPLNEWLFDRVFPMEDRLTEESTYWFSLLAILEYLTSGITSNFDMYKCIEAGARASVDAGFRTVLCGSINDFGGTTETLREEYERYNGYHPLISYELGFHAEYTTSRELMESIAELARELKRPVYLHNSETRKEVEDCVGRYGVSPTRLLADMGMFEYGGGGFHCVHLTREDVEIMKEKQLFAVTNPASNVKLASGVCPVWELVKEGITVGIGTDGPASNNCLDMFREMFLVAGLQKLKYEDAAAMDAARVLEMACVDGARVMGLSQCDSLEEGKLADLVLLDLKRPNMQPIHNVVKNVVYSGSKENVKLTMVDGRILYEDGRFYLGVDAEEIYAKAAEFCEKIFLP